LHRVHRYQAFRALALSDSADSIWPTSSIFVTFWQYAHWCVMYFDFAITSSSWFVRETAKARTRFETVAGRYGNESLQQNNEK